MSFKIYISNSLEKLAEKLCEKISCSDADIFKPSIAITQTDAMGKWLNITIAEKNSIVANLKVINPGKFVNEIHALFNEKKADIPSSEEMQWIIYSLLNEKEFEEQFPFVFNYFKNDSVKQIALASKIADLFDQYQIYRQDIIEAWNNKKIWSADSYAEHEKWQRWLWNNSMKIIESETKSKYQKKNDILNQLKLKANQDKINKMYPEIHIFGMSILTNFHLDILFAVSEFTEVNFYIQNPSPDSFWYNDFSEKIIKEWLTKKGVKNKDVLTNENNRLIEVLGKNINDTFLLLYSYNNSIQNTDDSLSIQPEGNSLLNLIQNDIYFNKSGDRKNVVTKEHLNDGSISIVSCYTPEREIEVLYNWLVRIMDLNKTAYLPREIMVMIPDVETYAPYIKNTFNNGPYKIPYSISDISYKNSDNYASALSMVLEIDKDSFTSENVLQLLDSKYIRNRFGINDIEIIRKAVNYVNIRYGINNREDDDTKYVSWSYGLERILLGYSIIGGAEYTTPEHTIYPYDLAEGTSGIQLLRFKGFVDELIHGINCREKEKDVNEWKNYLIHDVINKILCEPDETNESGYQFLIDIISNLDSINKYLNKKIPYDVFLSFFRSSLDSEIKIKGYLKGSVTFSSLKPMRSIPRMIIAILGLNKDAFPRKETKIGFNLMDVEKRTGDRNIKDSDKSLFLQTLLSTQDYFYLSYQGRSIKDNSSIPPSLLIDILLDYIESGFKGEIKDVKNILITEHPLHGFSKKYFNNNNRYYTYLGYKSADADKKESKAKDKKEFPTEISIENLVRFYSNPIEWYYNHILNIYYKNEDIIIPETEIFELDSLQNWELENEIITNPDFNIDNYVDLGIKKGFLPLKNMAEANIRTCLDETHLIRVAFQNITNRNVPSKLEINIKVGDKQITGRISNIFEDKHVVLCLSKSLIKYELKLWLEYLAIIASGNVFNSFLINRDGEIVELDHNKKMTPEKAVEILNELIKYFIAGNENILPFHPEISNQCISEGSYESAVNKQGEYNPYISNEILMGFFEDKEEEFASTGNQIIAEFKNYFQK